MPRCIYRRAGTFLVSEQEKHLVNPAPLMTVNDRNLVSFLCSCVFSLSRMTRQCVPNFRAP